MGTVGFLYENNRSNSAGGNGPDSQLAIAINVTFPQIFTTRYSKLVMVENHTTN